MKKSIENIFITPEKERVKEIETLTERMPNSTCYLPENDKIAHLENKMEKRKSRRLVVVINSDGEEEKEEMEEKVQKGMKKKLNSMYHVSNVKPKVHRHSNGHIHTDIDSSTIIQCKTEELSGTEEISQTADVSKHENITNREETLEGNKIRQRNACPRITADVKVCLERLTLIPQPNGTNNLSNVLNNTANKSTGAKVFDLSITGKKKSRARPKRLRSPTLGPARKKKDIKNSSCVLDVIDLVGENLSKEMNSVGENSSKEINSVEKNSFIEINLVEEVASNEINFVEKNSSDQINLVEEDSSNKINLVEEVSSNEISFVEKNSSDQINLVEENSANKINLVEEVSSDEINFVEKNSSDQIDLVEEHSSNKINLVEEKFSHVVQQSLDADASNNEYDDDDTISLHPDSTMLDEYCEDININSQSNCNNRLMHDKFVKINKCEVDLLDPTVGTASSSSLDTVEITARHDLREKLREKRLLTFRDSVTENFRNDVRGDQRLPNMSMENIFSDERRVNVVFQHNRAPETTNFTNKRKFCGMCFQHLRQGYCLTRNACRYSHEIDIHIYLVLMNYEKFCETLSCAIDEGFNFFVMRALELFVKVANSKQVMDMFQHIYNSNVVIPRITTFLAFDLMKRKVYPSDVIESIKNFIKPEDSGTLRNLVRIMKQYIGGGEFWSTLRPAVIRVQPDKYISEEVLRECMSADKDLAHLTDVYDNLVSRLGDEVDVNKELLESFHQFYEQRRNEAEAVRSTLIVDATDATDPIDSVDPVDQIDQVDSDDSVGPDDAPGTIGTLDTSLARTGSLIKLNTNRQKGNASRGENLITRRKRIRRVQEKLSESEDSDPGQKRRKIEGNGGPSVDDRYDRYGSFRDHCRKWNVECPLNVGPHNLEEGLKRNDFPIVIKILDKAKFRCGKEKALYALSLYRALSSRIKHSQYYLKKIIEYSVQLGKTASLQDIVYQVAKCLLITLTNRAAWVIAFRMLKCLQVYDFQYDAAFVILSAEIYLANRQAIEAFYLLKRYNITKRSRSSWRVTSNSKDSLLRARVFNVLLDTLSNESAEHGFTLFHLLCSEKQPRRSCFIDLSRYVDKLTTKILLEKREDLIVAIGKLILDHNFTLSTMTFRAMISTIFHSDISLATKLYRYANGFDVYTCCPKVSPVVHLIVKTDWLEEEMCLIFSQLLTEISLNVGHAIDRPKRASFPIYIIFEETSPGTEYHIGRARYRKTRRPKKDNKNLQRCKMRVGRVLRQQFSPPLRILKNDGRFSKLNISSVVNYFKSKSN